MQNGALEDNENRKKSYLSWNRCVHSSVQEASKVVVLQVRKMDVWQVRGELGSWDVFVMFGGPGQLLVQA